MKANVSQMQPHSSLYRPNLEPPVPMTQHPSNQPVEGRVTIYYYRIAHSNRQSLQQGQRAVN
ncbi:unnamed protein product [Taenia asiatica]|uniref:Uncharacterized protein n=1 Tax=Taenia asiatica TaxID=60517 RepID=A0A0R3VZK2_TAEAS|nr:unnamed protein product [Taenia asiatica]